MKNLDSKLSSTMAKLIKGSESTNTKGQRRGSYGSLGVGLPTTMAGDRAAPKKLTRRRVGVAGKARMIPVKVEEHISGGRRSRLNVTEMNPLEPLDFETSNVQIMEVGPNSSRSIRSTNDKIEEYMVRKPVSEALLDGRSDFCTLQFPELATAFDHLPTDVPIGVLNEYASGKVTLCIDGREHCIECGTPFPFARSAVRICTMSKCMSRITSNLPESFTVHSRNM